MPIKQIVRWAFFRGFLVFAMQGIEIFRRCWCSEIVFHNFHQQLSSNDSIRVLHFQNYQLLVGGLFKRLSPQHQQGRSLCSKLATNKIDTLPSTKRN